MSAAPHSAWQSFAAGCKFVRTGLYLELAAVAIWVVLAEGELLWNALFEMNWDGRSWTNTFAARPAGLLMYHILVALGCALVTVGRIRMARVPAGTGVFGVLTINTVLAVLRLTAILVAIWSLAVAVTSTTAGSYPGYAGQAYGAAVVAGLLADLATIPAMAVLAGHILSQPLRRRAAILTIAFQAIGVAYVLLLTVGVFSSIGLDALGIKSSNKPSALGQPSSFGLALGFLAIFGGLLVIQACYTVLLGSLYSTARQEVLALASRSGEPG
jgi:hypothetical protein